MNNNDYYSKLGGLPPQTQLLSSKAVFTTAYAVIPRGVLTDIVSSVLPHWTGTRACCRRFGPRRPIFVAAAILLYPKR